MPARAGQTGTPVIIPGTALARAIRDPARLPRQPRTRVAPLDRLVATDVGRLLAASGTDGITDANVVIGARRSGAGVVTGDADDLHSLDPNLARTVI